MAAAKFFVHRRERAYISGSWDPDPQMMAPRSHMTPIEEMSIISPCSTSGTTANACHRARAGIAAFPESAHTDANKVQAAQQVWLLSHVEPDGAAGPVLTFEGDSDAHIVRGLVAILLALYSGKNAARILAIDALALFDRIGLRENLTPQRSNGLRSMVERIRGEANAALAAAGLIAKHHRR